MGLFGPSMLFVLFGVKIERIRPTKKKLRFQGFQARAKNARTLGGGGENATRTNRTPQFHACWGGVPQNQHASGTLPYLNYCEVNSARGVKSPSCHKCRTPPIPLPRVKKCPQHMLASRRLWGPAEEWRENMVDFKVNLAEHVSSGKN